MQDLVGTIEKRMLALPGGTLRNFFLSLPTIDAETLAGKIQAPTLVMHGTEDCNVPFEYGEVIASRIPGAVFYPFVGRGHLPNCTAPGEFCEVLIQFLRTGTVPSVDMNRTHPDP
jgi:pimeloyl-ACP methyl ester carboxylesterase